jgi:MFS family permease
MTGQERRATAGLAALFATRMLGLFLVLPVFALHARGLPGGVDAQAAGLAFGIYGLTQALLLIPFGLASDRYGRKPILLLGLVLFALGSVWAVYADSVFQLTCARALQGAGAISAVITATLADLTRDSQRTKAMAVIGGSIALSFAASLVLGPLLYARVGMAGIFAIIAVLATLGMVVVVCLPKPPESAIIAKKAFASLLADTDLRRLNFGVFCLHFVQMALFSLVPIWLAQRLQLPAQLHAWVYLPALVGSLAVAMPWLMKAEREGRQRSAFLVGIFCLILAAVGLGAFALVSGLASFHQTFGLSAPWILGFLLLVFFIGFNMLEASLPSLVSRLAPSHSKGAALGVYNTSQALGLFAGPVVAGILQRWFGEVTVFSLCAVILCVWYLVAPGLTKWPGRSNLESESQHGISQ